MSDLRTGAMSGGSGEQALLSAACAQMATFYDLPNSVPAGMTDSKLPDAQSGGEKALNTAANVIGFLGGIGTNSSKKYTMTADPAAWRSGLSELMNATNAQFTAAMNGAR